MPSYENIHVDARLTNFAVGLVAQQFAWINRAFPVTPVSEIGGLVPNYGAEGLRVVTDLIGDFTSPWPTFDWELSDTTYLCEAHGQQAGVPTYKTGTERDLLERGAVGIGSQRVQVGIASRLLTYLAANATAVSAELDLTDATADPAEYFLTQGLVIAAATGGFPDACLMAPNVAIAMSRHAIVRDDIKYTTAWAQPSEDPMSFLAAKLSGYLGIDVIIPTAAANSAAEGQVATPELLWAGKALLYYRGAGIGLTDAAGRTVLPMALPRFLGNFYFTGIAGAGEGVGSYWVEDRLSGFGVNWARTFHFYDQVITYQTAGLLMTPTLT